MELPYTEQNEYLSVRAPCLFLGFAFCCVRTLLGVWCGFSSFTHLSSTHATLPSLTVQCKLSLMKSDLFINLKRRIHNKSAYDTTCELQKLELQLIERDAGTVAWVDLHLRPAFTLFFPERSGFV